MSLRKNTCANCKWFHFDRRYMGVDNGKKDDDGFCHRYPPLAQYLPRTDDKYEPYGWVRALPQVTHSWWCGEWTKI